MYLLPLGNKIHAYPYKAFFYVTVKVWKGTGILCQMRGSIVIGHQGTPGLCSSSLLQSSLEWPFGHALEGDQYHWEKPCR